MPHGDNQFFLCLTAIIDFSSPHGDNQFFLHLTAIIDFFSSPNGDNKYFLRLTAIIDFSLPHGKNQGNRFACRLALLKCYLWSTRGAATFLAQNLLIVACSLCLSSYELNGLCAIFLWPYSHAPSMAIFSLALRPCLTGIKVAPHDDILFGLPATPHGGN